VARLQLAGRDGIGWGERVSVRSSRPDTGKDLTEVAPPRATKRRKKMSLFQTGNFKLHSGDMSTKFIDCDALADEDINALAVWVAERISFCWVIGIPTGGERLAKELKNYTVFSAPTLIVDDVFTTGRSMESAKSGLRGEVIGVVIFARAKCPDWITPIFQLMI